MTSIYLNLTIGSYLVPDLHKNFIKALKLPKTLQHEVLQNIQHSKFNNTQICISPYLHHNLSYFFPYLHDEEITIIGLLTFFLQINYKLSFETVDIIYKFFGKLNIFSYNTYNTYDISEHYFELVFYLAFLRFGEIIYKFNRIPGIPHQNYRIILYIKQKFFNYHYKHNKEFIKLRSFIIKNATLDENLKIFLYFKDTKRRYTLQKIRIYLQCINSFNNLYFNTLEKRYSPNGNGFIEAQNEFTNCLNLI